jgi:acetylornithine/LysW-gamma-L-lysine aminotransferase
MSMPPFMLAIDSIQELENDLQLPLYAKRDIALVRGEGSYLFDSEGNRYLDAMSNYGVAALGHADPVFAEAMADQLQRLTTCHQSFYNDARAAALASIKRIAPDGLSRYFMSNSGAEAIEAGLKFAIMATGRHKVVALRRGYHGRTLGALSATFDPKYRKPFEPLPIPVTHVAFNDLDALTAEVNEETAAIILEPVQGEAGIFPADDDYLRAVRDLATAQGALLIADEVQTGFRTGAPFAITHAGISPDILCTAKAIGNGFPVGVTMVTEAVSETTVAGAHGTTFGSNPLACRAIVTTLQAFQDRDLYARSAELGGRLMTEIESLESPKIRQVRGRGYMIGVEMKERITPTLRALQENGVLALPASPVVFRLLPPLVWEEEQVDEFIGVLEKVLA